MSQSKNQRQPWLDILRTLAIAGVVLCHCVEGVYTFDVNSIQALGAMNRGGAIVMYTLGRVLGVPLFLMLTGYLLLGRSYDTEKCVRFWRKNWLHLFLCTEIWIVLYELFLLAYQGQPIPLGYLVRAMLFLEPSSMYHMWYMPMLLGFYGLLPLAAIALQKVETKVLLVPFLIFFVYSFGVVFYAALAPVMGGTKPVNQFSMGFSGGAYGLYLVSGYFLKRNVLQKIKTWTIMLLMVVSFATTVGLQYYAYGKGVAMGVWYDFPLVYICSVGLFELAARGRERIKEHRLPAMIARYSFGVFLMHMIVRCMVLAAVLSLGISLPLKLLVMWMVLFVGGLVLTWLVARIPKVGKYMLFIR